MDASVAKLSDDGRWEGDRLNLMLHPAPPSPLPSLFPEVLKHYLCVHFPHKMSKAVLELLKHNGGSGVPLIYLTYSSLCVHPSLGTADVLQACIGSPNVKAMQSMMFIKGPGKRGQATHQV